MRVHALMYGKRSFLLRCNASRVRVRLSNRYTCKADTACGHSYGGKQADWCESAWLVRRLGFGT